MKLNKDMSVEEFDNGYWYASKLKAFAKSIGVLRSSVLRKDQIEPLIRHYLKTGEVKQAPKPKAAPKQKDSDLGLRLDLPIRHYTNNPETKNFLKSESLKQDPDFKLKPGAMYRINRWRDAQIAAGVPITYGDLVDEFVKLNACDHYEPMPVTRYINFLSDYMKHESGATREEGIAAWHELKRMDVPKDYASWKRAKHA